MNSSLGRSDAAQWSFSAAVSSRKQMRPDKAERMSYCARRFCLSVCFSYCKYSVCSSAPSCFPVSIRPLPQLALSDVRAAGRSQGGQGATVTDCLPTWQNSSEVNHTCLYTTVREHFSLLTRAVPCGTKRGALLQPLKYRART